MSTIFKGIVRLRSRLYEKGYLESRELSHPVVSVGNLTVGGTGKTPLVIALAGGFRELGYRPVVLSRGYRRRSRGVVVVSRGNGPEVDWSMAGDEPFLIAQRLSGVSVVVGRDRFEAGRRAQSDGLGDLFILDDGFQHRQLSRNCDIVAIDPDDWNGEERLLPRGHWREPRSALGRADAVCFRREPGTKALAFDLPAFEFTINVDGIFRDGEPVDARSLGNEPVTAFAGIAGPERFFETVRSLGLNVVGTKSFPDHHPFRPAEIASLGNGHRITTEKDAVRLGSGDFLTLRVSANILSYESLRDLVLERIGPRVIPLGS